MEELAAAMRELSASNKQLLARVNQIEEEKAKKEENKRKCFFEMDVEFIMSFKKWPREKAIERLLAEKYDVAKVIQSALSHFLTNGACLEHVLAHYEYKKNRALMEGW